MAQTMTLIVVNFDFIRLLLENFSRIFIEDTGETHWLVLVINLKGFHPTLMELFHSFENCES